MVALMEVGDRVYWNRVPRGGYCYPQRIPAQVVSLSGGRAKIKVAKLDGSIVERHVRQQHLAPRSTSFPDLKE